MRWAQWERKFLAAQLKLDFDDEEREELFLAWNVHRESKERKMQLARKLWAPDQTRHASSCCTSAMPRCPHCEGRVIPGTTMSFNGVWVL